MPREDNCSAAPMDRPRPIGQDDRMTKEQHPSRVRRGLALGGTAGLLLPNVWAAVPGIGERQILIGQTIALQDGKNVYAADAQAGIKAYLEDVNRNGGVFGRQIVLRTLDDNNDAAKAEANARQLAGQNCFVLFGSLEGGPSTAVMKAAVDLQVPFIGPMAGSPGFRRPHQPLVFPVRAEHREEFRALITQGQRLGFKKVALKHADSAVGREHLTNVEKLCAELGMAFGGGLPFKGDITDEGLDALHKQCVERQVDLVINHGSAGVYERFIRRARSNGNNNRAAIWGVNSGSSPLAAKLGELAHGMVFTQIVPNPNARKTALVREYQERMARFQSEAALSYGSLEGYMTAKALVVALRGAGANPSRASLLAAAENLTADLGGLQLRWRKGDHTGCGFVDLAMVGRDGRFLQ
jgi:branched-chain amino acid transport system substrate-binding protein